KAGAKALFSTFGWRLTKQVAKKIFKERTEASGRSNPFGPDIDNSGSHLRGDLDKSSLRSQKFWWWVLDRRLGLLLTDRFGKLRLNLVLASAHNTYDQAEQTR
ncbi:MAG: hypothetical protein JRE63_09295, partial [Deltaproteobacteria bacterium]|nr:hypothetical protein [Deltaproteobacteria bacterium]